jgi:DNA-binding transcriptional LysR family regulator
VEIDDLRAFVEVANAGGISSAARRLGVPKSLVSRRLHRLEAELGIQLLARTTRGAALTDAGSTFRDYAAKACAEIDSGRDLIVPDGPLRGRLRVAAPLSFGPTHFSPVLARMRLLHPLLHVHACYSDQFVDLVSEGFDCAIRLGYLQDSNLVARRVGPLYGSLVASPEYIRRHGAPEVPDDVMRHEALMQGTEPWRFTDGEDIVTVHPTGHFKADNAVALAAAAAEGLGIGWLPDGVTDPYIASGRLVRIMERYPPPPAGIYVVRPSSQHPSRRVQVLTELLIQCFGEGAQADATAKTSAG